MANPKETATFALTFDFIKSRNSADEGGRGAPGGERLQLLDPTVRARVQRASILRQHPIAKNNLQGAVKKRNLSMKFRSRMTRKKWFETEKSG